MNPIKDEPVNSGPTRRSFLRRLFGVPAALIVAACTGRIVDSTGELPAGQATSEAAPSLTPTAAAEVGEAALPTVTPTSSAVAQALAPTPACGDDDDDPTPAQTEGPYYTPNTPERTSLLEPDISGEWLVLTGYVLTTDCRPVAAALLDFWHCDAQGVYDNVGYKLRGHQFSDETGRYTLETIVPGVYPGRTRHIHVKVQAPNQPVLTTQLYFPGEPENARDGIYRPDLEMAYEDTADGKAGSFNFVLAI